MGIKSKKWYQNQIKALENASSNLFNEGIRLSNIYLNDLPEMFKAQKPVKEEFNKNAKQLYKLKAEYSLYYR
jgi:hypothetical protein